MMGSLLNDMDQAAGPLSLHIAIICPALGGAGSVASVALHHAQELAKRFRVSLVSDSFPTQDLPGITCLKVKSLRFPFLHRYAHVPNEIIFSLTATRAVARLHQRDPVSLVICHGHVATTFAVSRLQQAFGIALGMVTHGDIFDRPAGTYDSRLTWLYQRMTPTAYRHADLVVVLSPHMAELARRGGARRERVVLIPNGIDLRDIGLGGAELAAANVATDCLELLYVGRLSVDKGVGTLIAAVAILGDREVSFRLRIVGSGPLASALVAQVRELRLDDIVQFIPAMPRRELGGLYRSAHIVCVPSLSDPLPTVVLEAMAAGVAVVGSDAGGIPFMVEDTVTGLIFPANDAVAQADALQRIAHNPGLASRMGAAGQRRAEREFNWARIGQSLANAIEQAREPATLVMIAPNLIQGGSVGAVAWRQAVELSRGFHQVILITRAVPEGGSTNIRPLIVSPMSWNWLHRFCHVPNELSFLHASRKALQRLCRQERVNLVWCHGHGVTALVAAPLKRRFGFSVIMTTHGDIFDRPLGTYSSELTWFYRRVTPPAYRGADRIQALSPYMGELAVTHGAAPHRVRVIPNGIDPHEIGAADPAPRPAATFMPQGTLRLVYVGSLWTLKRVDVLLRAVAALNGPGEGAWDGDAAPLRVTLTLVGAGPARQSLEHLTAELGLIHQVIFVGQAPRHAMACHYQEADLLCLPSASEALPTVVLEAMACGLPVVGSATGGIPFLVDEDVSGHLAIPGDVTSLGQAIRRAAMSPEHLAHLGEQGLMRARAHFGWDRIAPQLDELVHDLLAPPTHHPEA